MNATKSSIILFWTVKKKLMEEMRCNALAEMSRSLQILFPIERFYSKFFYLKHQPVSFFFKQAVLVKDVTTASDWIFVFGYESGIGLPIFLVGFQKRY